MSLYEVQDGVKWARFNRHILWYIEYDYYLKIDNFIDTYNILINKNDMKTINECKKHV